MFGTRTPHSFYLFLSCAGLRLHAVLITHSSKLHANPGALVQSHWSLRVADMYLKSWPIIHNQRSNCKTPLETLREQIKTRSVHCKAKHHYDTKKPPNQPIQPSIILHNFSQWEDRHLELSQKVRSGRDLWAGPSEPTGNCEGESGISAYCSALLLYEGFCTRNGWISKLMTNALAARETILWAAFISTKRRKPPASPLSQTI